MRIAKGTNAASFRFNGSSVTIASGSIQEEQLEFFSLASLQSTIDSAEDGSTIDLEGKNYISSLDRGGVSISHDSAIVLPTDKTITIENGNFYGGFQPSWLADELNTFGPGVYRASCDFKTNGSIVEYPPFLWCSYEKAPKQIIYPPNERDIEFGTVWADDDIAVDDYSLGNVTRVEITTSSNISRLDGYLMDHRGNPFVSSYNLSTNSIVPDSSWDATVTQTVEGSDIGLNSISASRSSGSWVIQMTFGTTDEAIDYFTNSGKVIFLNPGSTSAQVTYTSFSRDGSVVSFTSDSIGSLVESIGIGIDWEVRLTYRTVGGVVFTNPSDIAGILQAFNFNEVGGLISDSRGCSLNVQSSDNRVFWCPVQSVTEEASPNEIRFLFSEDFNLLTFSSVSSYLNAAIFGPPANLESGQIVYFPNEQTMYWKPRDVRSVNSSVFGIASAELFVIGDNYAYPDTLDDLSSGSKYVKFSNCSMRCGRQMLRSTSPRVGALVHISDCEFSYGQNAISRVQGRVERSVFDQFFYSQLYGSPGLTVDKCWFGPTYQSSNINMSGTPDSSYGLPEGTTQGNGLASVVTNSFFCNPLTEHGQCVSFYQGTCNNAVFSGNIVFNTTRGVTMQHATYGSGTIRTDQQPYRFEMKGNLFIETNYRTLTPAVWYSQNFGTVYNHDQDAFWSSEDLFPNFRYLVASNTHVSLSTSFTPGQLLMSSSSQPFRLTSRFHNNYFQGAQISGSSVFPTLTNGKSDVVRMSNNFWTQRCQSHLTANCAADIGQVDGIAQNPNRESTVGCYLSSSTLLPTDLDLLNGATDGGQIGVRWVSSAPSLADVKSIKDRSSGYTAWYTTYISDFENLPDDEAIYAGGSTPDDTWLEPGVRNAPDLGTCL